MRICRELRGEILGGRGYVRIELVISLLQALVLFSRIKCAQAELNIYFSILTENLNS